MVKLLVKPSEILPLSYSTSRELGCFFYGMPETGSPQWIYTHPVDGAPRTGQGIFPSAIIEVTQVRVSRCSPSPSRPVLCS